MEVSQRNSKDQYDDQKTIAILKAGVQRLRNQVSRLKATSAEFSKRMRRESRELKHMVEFQRQQIEQLEQTESTDPIAAFSDPNVFRYRYAASMVALCVNLAKLIPLNSIGRTLELVLESLGIKTQIPDRETITRWLKCIGLDQVEQNQQCSPEVKKKSPSMIWIVDHSNQLGTKKILVILGLSTDSLPEPGKTLSLNKLEVLLVKPGESWKRENVRTEYEKLAKLIGKPGYLLCDGAVELHESADVLCDDEHVCEVLRDFKHFAANRFEATIGKSAEFVEFQAQMGKARCKLQQSSLAHLTPPALRTKSRFMNISSTVKWALTMLSVLDDPAGSLVPDREKLESCLGWVRGYRETIAYWQRCCELIGTSLKFINTNPLQNDSGERLDKLLRQTVIEGCERSDRMFEQLMGFVQEAAKRIKPGEKAWLSSESLESLFGKFKWREGQQSRRDFTGLVATLPTLMRDWTAVEVRQALQRTGLIKVVKWVKENIGETMHTKRTAVNARYAPKKKICLESV